MAVKIRLRRMGAKKSPFYRVVVADSRYPRDGRFIEQLGTYDPTKNPSVVSIDLENAKKWIANGAQPTDTVKRLLKIAENPVAEKPAKAKAAPKAEKAPEAPIAEAVTEEATEVAEEAVVEETPEA